MEELELEIVALRNKLKQLENENNRLKQILTENDLSNEIFNTFISPEEQICIDGILHLKQLFENGTFSKDDAVIFDTLHKNLRMIRGKSVDTSGKKSKKADIKELFSIVDGKSNGQN